MGKRVEFAFIAEKDGEIEREFKAAVSDAFWKSGLAIQRAYLVLIDIEDEYKVMLGIVAGDVPRDQCVALAQSVFQELFSSDQELFFTMLDDDSEAKVRRVAKPFYEVTLSSDN